VRLYAPRLFGLGALVLVAGCGQVHRHVVLPRLHPRAGPPELHVREGRLVGTREAGTESFRGIPYARPPIGALRFRPPQPAASWKGVRDAKKFGPPCLQYDRQKQRVVGGQEDCLTLNVWAKSPDEQRPILVFLHGGTNEIGSPVGSGKPWDTYDGADLAGRGVVVVTVQYRLGVLGWVGHEAFASDSGMNVFGNYGLLDQIEALRWVRANARAMGGDPDRVTLAGHSAGGVDICALLASPLAKGLFKRAIVLSGPCYSRSRAVASEIGRKLVLAAGCTESNARTCLRAKDARTLGEALARSPATLPFGPTWGDDVLPVDPLVALARGDAGNVEIMVGTTRDESERDLERLPESFVPRQVDNYEGFVGITYGRNRAPDIVTAYPLDRFAGPREALARIWADRGFQCPARRLAMAASTHSTVYRFVWERELSFLSGLHACHGCELDAFFGHDWMAKDEAESKAMTWFLSRMLRFVNFGDPNGGTRGTTTQWPRFTAATESYASFDDIYWVGQRFRTSECKMWDGLK
jgi:para-nitrobenzyl esterase